MHTRQINVREWGVGNPCFASIDDITSVGFLSSRLHTRRVRPVVWFCEALPSRMSRGDRWRTVTTHKATYQLSRSQNREVLFLLLLRSELVNWVHNERRLNGSCGPVAGVNPIPPS